MYPAKEWLARKAHTLNFVARRFGRAPGDVEPKDGQMSRADATELLLAEDAAADDCMPMGSPCNRVRLGIAVAGLICRAGILADLISLRRDVVRDLLDASLGGDKDGMCHHLNRLWDCLGLPPVDGPDAGNVLQFGLRYRRKQMGLKRN